MRIGVVLVGAAVAVAAVLGLMQLSGVFEASPPQANAPAPAATRLNNRVIVVTDDSVAASIARGNPVLDAALAALESELRRSGFEVHDGRAIPVTNSALGNERRSDAEIVALARRPQPVDAVVLFTLLTVQEFTIQAQNAGIRGTARVLRASDGGDLGHADWASPQRWTLPYACDRACLIEATVTEAPTVGTTIGERLAATLREAR